MEIKQINKKIEAFPVAAGSVLMGVGGLLVITAFIKDVDENIARLIVFWFGLIMALIGFALAFYIERFTFDPMKRTLIIKRGYLLPLVRQTYSFSEIKAIEGHCSRVGSDGKPSYTYMGYLILENTSIKFGYDWDKERFKKTLTQVQSISKAPLRMELDGPPQRPSVESPIRFNKILLLLFLFVICSGLLIKFVWPL